MEVEVVVEDLKWLMWRPILIESKLSSGSILIGLSLRNEKCIITQRQMESLCNLSCSAPIQTGGSFTHLPEIVACDSLKAKTNLYTDAQ